MNVFSIRDINFSDRIRNILADTGSITVGTRLFNGFANVTFEDCLTFIGCNGQYHHVENSCGSYDLMCKTGDPSLTVQDIICERDDPCSTAKLVAYGAVALAATTVTVCTLLYHYSKTSTKSSDANKDTIEYDDFTIGSSEIETNLTPAADSSEADSPVDYTPVDTHLEQNPADSIEKNNAVKPIRSLYWRSKKPRFKFIQK